MAMADYLLMTGLAAGGAALFLPAWAWSARRRRGRLAKGGAAADPQLEQRMETIEGRLAEIGAGASEERLQAMAGSLLTLVRDKNATMETALAGLDQLRARMRTLEQIGDSAEARGLFEGLVARLDAAQAAQAAGDAALQARLAVLEGTDPGAALARQFARLMEHKDAAVAAVLERLAPLEARLEEVRRAQVEPRAEFLAEPLLARVAALEAAAEARDPRALLDAFAARLDAVQAANEARLSALEAPGENPFEEVSGRLAQLYAQKDATVETVFARLAPLEARLGTIEAGLAAQDPLAALDRFAERLEAMQARVSAIEAPGESPFSEISEQLTRLYAQKDATVETVFARLAPLEARLGTIEAGMAAQDPRAALDRFAERLEAMQARVAAIEAPGESPFAEISEQLTRLYAQKDATVETVFARLAPLEARLAGLETAVESRDPRVALDRFAERLEAMQARLVAVEVPGENPFAEISEQLTRLYAQKDATVETVFARLAPLEVRLGTIEAGMAALNPRAALDRFAERLETMQARMVAVEALGENPFAEISEQLTRLYAQKDATVETVFVRLAPLEARLGTIEAGMAAQDPRAVLDRFAERLEAMQARLVAVEAPGENPFAEISEQLTRLYAQKDATVETVFARLAPLEARLAGLETAVESRDPRVALDRFAERLEAMQARLVAVEVPGENPFAEISEQLTRLYAQKDATVETVFARLAPLEVRLGTIEAGMAALNPRAALDRFAERLETMQARMVAVEALGENPFAEISEQLTRLYAQKDATVETVFVRLAPLEARLGTIEAGMAAQDPRAVLDRFAERLEAMQARLVAVEAPGENPFAEISEQLTRLYAQKDATVETVFARLAPLEARLAGLETAVEGRDPRVALDRFAERLEAMQARIVAVEAPAENPFAEISEQLTRLYAQKDATVETVFARLAPLEARLGTIEAGMAGSLPRLAALEAADPKAALAEIAGRIVALQDAQGAAAERLAALQEAAGDARPFTEIADQLAQLYAQRDAAVEAVAARMAPLEARIAELEARPQDTTSADAARAEAEEIATQMIALRAAAAQTELFADRLALLEASLPRLSAAQALMMQALERQGVRREPATGAVPGAAARPVEQPVAAALAVPAAETTPAQAPGSEAVADVLADLPRVVSLHHG